MKRSTLCLLALLVAVPAAAQNTAQRPSHSSPRAATRTTQPARDAAADSSDVPLQTPPPPTPPSPPSPTPPGPTPAICCCRVWSHGWQYSWRPNTECTAQNGSCVTPDHC